MRAKATWFKADRPRAPEEIASVAAMRLWRLADRFVDNLSRAGCGIGAPERGLRLIAEVLAFGLQACDRAAHRRLAEAQRAALVQAMGVRLAALLEENGLPGRAAHIALFNRRGADYASFEDLGSFPALRYLAQQVSEVLDPPWVMDQVMDIEAPALLEALHSATTGIYSGRQRSTEPGSPPA